MRVSEIFSLGGGWGGYGHRDSGYDYDDHRDYDHGSYRNNYRYRGRRNGGGLLRINIRIGGGRRGY